MSGPQVNSNSSSSFTQEVSSFFDGVGKRLTEGWGAFSQSVEDIASSLSRDLDDLGTSLSEALSTLNCFSDGSVDESQLDGLGNSQSNIVSHEDSQPSCSSGPGGEQASEVVSEAGRISPRPKLADHPTIQKGIDALEQIDDELEQSPCSPRTDEDSCSSIEDSPRADGSKNPGVAEGAIRRANARSKVEVVHDWSGSDIEVLTVADKLIARLKDSRENGGQTDRPAPVRQNGHLNLPQLPFSPISSSAPWSFDRQKNNSQG